MEAKHHSHNITVYQGLTDYILTQGQKTLCCLLSQALYLLVYPKNLKLLHNPKTFKCLKAKGQPFVDFQEVRMAVD